MLRAAPACVVLLLAWSAAHAASPALTVYSRDLAFVREGRTLALKGGSDTLQLAGVPDRIDFASARLIPSGSARATRLAYRLDAASGNELIDRARGARVRVTLRGDRALEGTLVAADDAWLTVRSDDGSVTTASRAAVEDVRIAGPSGELRLGPTLEAVIEGGKPGSLEAELDYLTGGFSWSAEHTVVRSGETEATWSTTVVIENTSGREYRDARVRLVAGEPRREGVPPPVPMARGLQMSAAEEKVDLTEQAFSEYHLYTLDRPATLRDRERQSLTMLAPRAIHVTPRYLVRGGVSGVAAQLEIENRSAAGLGVPLPSGRVRFYERDAVGELHWTGESRIAHTAEDEKLTLDVGTVFDLAMERREVFNRRISDREREMEIEVKLRNRKKTNVTIVVEEPVAGDHEIVKKSHEYTHKDANTLRFEIPVAAGKEAVLDYVVRVRY